MEGAEWSKVCLFGVNYTPQNTLSHSHFEVEFEVEALKLKR